MCSEHGIEVDLFYVLHLVKKVYVNVSFLVLTSIIITNLKLASMTFKPTSTLKST